MSRKIEFDLKAVKNLCKLIVTQEEMAAFFGVSLSTIEARMRDEPEFRMAVEDGYADGRMRLRRWQMRAAAKGSAAMLIFLGKNLLGQKDQVDAVHSGSVTQEFTVKAPHAYHLPAPSAVSEAIEGDFSHETVRPN